MNNFTKEELELIVNYMFGGSYNVSSKDLGELEKKIQGMIENYCEHEEEIIEGARMKIHMGKCIKCGLKLRMTSRKRSKYGDK